MRRIIPLLFVFCSSLASAYTVEDSGLHVIEMESVDNKMFRGCSIKVKNEFIPLKNIDKVVLNSESIVLSSDTTQIKFEVPSEERQSLLWKLNEQQAKCVKRVREYRRHPAY